MDFDYSPISFQSIYGPSAGQAVATRATDGKISNLGANLNQLPLSLPALFALGFAVWYLFYRAE